jgi:uncharacterized membrane-anchored protein
VHPAFAQDAPDARQQELIKKLRALDWQLGPRDVSIASNSTLTLPQGYVFLDAANTSKFEELNQNIPGGKEVMVAPKSLRWTAYFLFEDSGYVRDDERIDANATLATLKERNEKGNQMRQQRGWAPLHLVGWSMPPAYNDQTKRLEWSTVLRLDNGAETTNFATKVLGRHGFTTVVLAAAPADTQTAIAEVDQLLTGYHFNAGETYAEFHQGDKVAKYGLAGLIVGGAAAAALKTGLFAGLWKALIVGGAAFWKLLVAGAVAVSAGIRSWFRRKSAQGT